MFTVILGALWAMLVVTSDALAPANQITGLATMLGLVAWAGAQYRRAGPPIARDVLVLLSLAGMVVAFREAGWVYGPAFLVLFQRTLDTRGVWTWVWTGIAFSAFEAVRLGEADASPLFSLPSLITLAGYAIGAYIMRTLAEASRAHERSARREAQLGRGAHELLTATTTEEIAEIALATSLRVVAEPDASGSVWTRAGEGREFRLLATAGPQTSSQQVVDLGRFPPRMVDVLETGVPVVAGPDTVEAIRHHITLDPGINELMLLPIVRREVAAVVAVGLSRRADVDLVDVLGRFSAELSLAWERVELLTRLQEANHELRRADDLKNQFVSMVSHELRGRLFEPFSQDDVGDRRTSRGVGLGLAICRDLLLANGGTITHRETPGGGATFVVDLPAA